MIKRSGLFAFVIAISIVFLIRQFIAEPFFIPTPSMEQTLLEGDYIFVNKIACGSRFPITPLSVPMIEKKWYIDFIQLSGFRLFGDPSIKRNDVIVFNYPMEDDYPVDHKTKFVKRCMALPGDQISIKDGKVFINDSIADKNEVLQKSYVIEFKKKYTDDELKKILGIKNIQELSYKKDVYLITIKINQLDEIKEKKEVKSIKSLDENENTWDETIFPSNEIYHWNATNFGPLFIPKKNTVIELNKQTIPFYKRLICVYEKNKLEIINDEIFINEVKTSTYKVKMNYYFVMGDNRDNSMDSRYWGFVPENHLIGKASLVLFSTDKKNSSIRWERIFKSVR